MIDKEQIVAWYERCREAQLTDRRITFDDIKDLLESLPDKFDLLCIGKSENGIPIYRIAIGSGSKRVLLWSQMHGNESTGTKALFDLFNYMGSEDPDIRQFTQSILAACSLRFIVLLNPDGAEAFTRENAKGIDLNRDAVAQNAVESKILRTELDNYKPDFCFNLHDQRSIFNVKGTPNPATISFLAPSEEETRKLTPGRIATMSVIVAMNELLQQIIPNHVGRYTDEFYPTATGDNFQKLGYNTILIEAGHYNDDYQRNITRKFNCIALLQGLYFIANTTSFTNYKPYFDIPNNDNKFLDAIYTNVSIEQDDVVFTTEVGIQYKFEMVDSVLKMRKHIEITGDLSEYITQNRINAENKSILELELSNS